MKRIHYVKSLSNTPSQLMIKAPKTSKAVGARDKYWDNGQVINIYFQWGNDNQRNLVRKVAKEIEEFVNLKFEFVYDSMDSDIRISFVEDGTSWSYEGTDALYISKGVATMNLGWLLSDPDDIGTVRHELLHAIGAVHEHNWGDIEYDAPCLYTKYAEFGWAKEDVDFNIINHRHNVDKSEVRDWNSIMHYPLQFDLDCIINADKIKLPTTFNSEFSVEDKRFWSEIYPLNKKEDSTDETDLKEELRKQKELAAIYKKGLDIIYSNNRSARGQLKKITKQVCDNFGLSTKGTEQELLNNIKSFLNG